MLLALLLSGSILQTPPHPDPAAAAAAAAAERPMTELPYCDPSLAAGVECSLFSDSPPAFDACASPYGRVRAACAVEEAVALQAELKADGVDCGDAATMWAMNRCAGARVSWENARMEVYLHAALTRAYEGARADLETAMDVGFANPYGMQFVVDLHETQRKWEDYGQQVCGSLGEQYHGGSIRPLMVAGCLEELARERSRALWAYSLGGHDGDLTWPEPKAPVSEVEIQSMIARFPVDADRIATRAAVPPAAH